MQLKFAAALFASSLATMTLAGDTGVGAGSVDSLVGAVLDHGAPARDLDPMRNERFVPRLDNATFVHPYVLPNEYPIHEQMMSLYSVLDNSGPSHGAEPTRTSAVTASATDIKVAEQPNPTPSGTCSLKNKVAGTHCEASKCKSGGGTCSMGNDGKSCKCTKDAA